MREFAFAAVITAIARAAVAQEDLDRYQSYV